jgi:hypothetical protein
MTDLKQCPVCGSFRGACPTLAQATRHSGQWCPEPTVSGDSRVARS